MQKYHRPPLKWLLRFKEYDVGFHSESDARSLKKIGKFSRISDLIAIVDDDHHHYMQEITAISVMASEISLMPCAELGFYS